MFVSVSRPLIPVVSESGGACVALACPEQIMQTWTEEMEVHLPYYQGRKSMTKGLRRLNLFPLFSP